MLLYTVDRGDFLSPSLNLNLSIEDPHSLPYLSIDGVLETVELERHLKELYPDGLSHHGWRYLKSRHTYGTNPDFQHYTTFFTEMNLEYVRNAYYSDKTSRLQSIFACGSIEDAKVFRGRMGNSQGQNKIYEIECERFLKLDMNIIFLGVQNISGSYLAHKYWKGESGNNPFWEYIVQLPAKVLREVT